MIFLLLRHMETGYKNSEIPCLSLITQKCSSFECSHTFSYKDNNGALFVSEFEIFVKTANIVVL